MNLTDTKAANDAATIEASHDERAAYVPRPDEREYDGPRDDYGEPFPSCFSRWQKSRSGWESAPAYAAQTLTKRGRPDLFPVLPGAFERDFARFVSRLPRPVAAAGWMDVVSLWATFAVNRATALALELQGDDLAAIHARLSLELEEHGLGFDDVRAFERAQRGGAIFPSCEPYVMPEGFDRHGFKREEEETPNDEL